MPLIEPVARCRKFNSLSLKAQWFYLQLKTVLDTAGRHEADPLILLSALFPLRKDTRPSTDIPRWLRECEQAGLLRCYADLQGRSIVEVFDARQIKMRDTSKLDPPEGQMPLITESPPDRGKVREEKRREEKRARAPEPGANDEVKGTALLTNGDVFPMPCPTDGGHRHAAIERPLPEADIPTLPEVMDYAAVHSVSEASAQTFFDHHENKNLWLNQFNRMIDWRKTLVTWGKNDRKYKSLIHANSSPGFAKNHRPPAGRNLGTLNNPSDYAGITKKD